MRISLHTQSDIRSNTHYGYGKSFIEIQKAFRKYSYDNEKFFVDFNSPRCNVQMYYGPDPVATAHHKGQYRIHMSQHESSLIMPHKVHAYSVDCEEAWTANYWGAEAMIRSGVPESMVFVYEHGVDPKRYKKKKRGNRDKIRFLHIDSGSPRKRADLVEKAFREIYKKYGDSIELTLKYTHHPHRGEDWNSLNILKNGGDWIDSGIRYINETLSDEEMESLIDFHDVLVYPSEGEGFGMIPLEAMATGMPVISTHEWSSYSKYFMDEALTSEIKESEIDWMYPKIGDAVIVNFDSIIYQMEKVIENIEDIATKYYNQAEDIAEEYSWSNKTKIFLDSVMERLGPDLFSKRIGVI